MATKAIRFSCRSIHHLVWRAVRTCVPAFSLFLVTGCALTAMEPASEAASRPKSSLELQTIVPEKSDDVLFNPGMGVYLGFPPMDAKPDEWFMQIADIAYYRVSWADLNPEEGVYTFDKWFGPRLDYWVKKHGKRFAFGVMSQSMHSKMKYVTPKWVFDRGVPGVTHYSSYFKDDQIDPVFWDDRYLDCLAEFIAKLGEYIDGREGIEFVDMRSIGEWGEMHLARWTPEQLEATGFTQTRYIMAYRRMIDAFAEAFPHTRVFLNVGGHKHQSINDYAALRGMHFRQDGLKPGGASYNCGEWLYKPYARRGVICNYEFHAGYQSALDRGWSPKETIDAALDTPLSYLNTVSWFGGNGLRKAPQEARDYLTLMARRLGYRFVLSNLELPAKFHLRPGCSARLPLWSTWRNEGLAPCYESFALRWSLHDADDKKVFSDLVFPKTPTTNWWPGEELESETAVLRLPSGLTPGRYQLKVTVVNPETGAPVNIGIAGRDAHGSYAVAGIEGIASDTAGGCVHQERFEDGIGEWAGMAGMNAVAASGKGRNGSGALSVVGTQPKGWNYASTPIAAPLVPAARYRLTVWMLVDRLEPGKKAPYVKLASERADGKWLQNFGSNRYDLTKLGTWQKLTAIAETSLDAAVGRIAIEKGANTMSVTADIRLDDIELELLEAP